MWGEVRRTLRLKGGRIGKIALREVGGGGRDSKQKIFVPLLQKEIKKMLFVSDVGVCYKITGTMFPYYTSLSTIWLVWGNVLLVVHIKSKNWFETQKVKNGYQQPGCLPPPSTSLHCWVWPFDKSRLSGHPPGVEACRVGKRSSNWTCNTLLRTATHYYTHPQDIDTPISQGHHTATQGHHTATQCSTMQHTATHCACWQTPSQLDRGK